MSPSVLIAILFYFGNPIFAAEKDHNCQVWSDAASEVNRLHEGIRCVPDRSCTGMNCTGHYMKPGIYNFLSSFNDTRTQKPAMPNAYWYTVRLQSCGVKQPTLHIKFGLSPTKLSKMSVTDYKTFAAGTWTSALFYDDFRYEKQAVISAQVKTSGNHVKLSLNLGFSVTLVKEPRVNNHSLTMPGEQIILLPASTFNITSCPRSTQRPQVRSVTTSPVVPTTRVMSDREKNCQVWTKAALEVNRLNESIKCSPDRACTGMNCTGHYIRPVWYNILYNSNDTNIRNHFWYKVRLESCRLKQPILHIEFGQTPTTVFKMSVTGNKKFNAHKWTGDLVFHTIRYEKQPVISAQVKLSGKEVHLNMELSFVIKLIMMPRVSTRSWTMPEEKLILLPGSNFSITCPAPIPKPPHRPPSTPKPKSSKTSRILNVKSGRFGLTCNPNQTCGKLEYCFDLPNKGINIGSVCLCAEDSMFNTSSGRCSHINLQLKHNASSETFYRLCDPTNARKCDPEQQCQAHRRNGFNVDIYLCDCDDKHQFDNNLRLCVKPPNHLALIAGVSVGVVASIIAVFVIVALVKYRRARRASVFAPLVNADENIPVDI